MSQRCLIDSHVLIWLLFEPERLGQRAISTIEQSSEVLVSVVSLWELALKHQKGKLAYTPAQLIEGVGALGLGQLTLTTSHILKLGSIKLSHQDPFDHLLVVQSEVEGCVFLTADKVLLSSGYLVVDVTV